jgi:hypothetical protein
MSLKISIRLIGLLCFSAASISARDYDTSIGEGLETQTEPSEMPVSPKKLATFTQDLNLVCRNVVKLKSDLIFQKLDPSSVEYSLYFAKTWTQGISSEGFRRIISALTASPPNMRLEVITRGIALGLGKPAETINPWSCPEFYDLYPKRKPSKVAPSAQNTKRMQLKYKVSTVSGPGSLGKTAISQVLKRGMGLVKTCLLTKIPAKEKLRFVITFRINDTGKVIQNGLGKSKISEPATQQCILDKVNSWEFPSPVGGPVDVRVPVLYKSTK